MRCKKPVLFLIIISLLTAAGCKSSDNKTKTANTSVAETEDMVGNMNKTGLPIVKEKMTFRFAGFKHNQIVKPMRELLGVIKLEESTNIHIEWTEIVEQGKEEKLNLMIASGNLPDAFLNCAPNLEKNGSLGIYTPVEGLIDKWGPNIKANFEKRPDMRKLITAPDGHIYGFPRYYESGQHNITGGMLVNKKWLKELGLEVPKTTDDFLNVLRAAKGKDLNGNGKIDEIPFGAMKNERDRPMELVTEGYGNIYGAFGLPTSNVPIFVDDNGKVQFTYSQDSYKEGVKFMNKLVSEGLTDPEMLTMTQATYRAKGKDLKYLFYYEWAPYITFGANANDYEFIPQLTGPKGDQKYAWNPTVPNPIGMVITKACKNPEILTRWADYMADPIVSLENSEGYFGQNIIDNKDGTYSRKSPMEIHEVTSGNEPSVLLRETYAKIMPGDWDIQRTAKQKMYEPVAAKKNVFPNVIQTPQEAQELSTLTTDIMGYAKQMQAKWVSSGGTDAEWDAYVKQLNNMGLKRYIEIYEGMYKRYTSIK